MFSRKEQYFLLELLRCREQRVNFRVYSSFDYRTMSVLIENGYVKILGDKPRIYGLTVIGQCLASLIAKHTRTEKRYVKYAGNVEMLIYK